MVRLSEYDNIIPVGDHCCISMILNELQLRKQSYPFDWVTNVDELHDTNIIYNTQLIRELYATDNIDAIVQKYLGDAFPNKHVNSNSNIYFPHDTEDVPDIFEKYKRRFTRLKSDLNKKNIFILVTRHYYIEEEAFQKIVECLLEYNKESLILFISGTVHEYITSGRYSNVIFKYIEYDISKFHSYDYTDFRPSIMKFMTDLFDNPSNSRIFL